MIDPNGRYATTKQAELELRDGQRVPHLVPPLLPHPDDHTAARLHRVTDSDRADIIAAKTYGQATAWWVLANANTVFHPDQLTEVAGATRVIPLPDVAAGETS